MVVTLLEQPKVYQNQCQLDKSQQCNSRNLWERGCQVYAIQITNMLEKEDKSKLEDFVVLRKFRDMFVDEISELPPRREIDFSIDLLPG
jgi:hypothetical protein